ncbi:MAG: tetratricopeptide repeat protein, partial [Myxococcota bacterium]
VNNFLKAADLRRRYLGDLDSAVADLEEVLRHEPGQQEAYESLREIFSRRGDPEALYRLFERRSQAPIGVEGRKDMLLRMAEIAFARLDRHDLALEAHERVLELDPGHIQSYRILAELHESAGRWSEAVDALIGVVGLTREPSLLARTYRSMAAIYDQHLNHKPRAIEAYRELMRHAPDDLESQRRQAELLAETGQWEPAARAYGNLLKRERRRSKLKADLMALARICADGLHEPDRAEQCLVQAQRLDPFDLTVAEALVEHLRSVRARDRLMTHLVQTSRHFAGLLADGLRDDTHHARALEGLFTTARWSDDWDRAMVVARVAQLLEVDTEPQRALLERATHPSHAERLPTQPIPIDRTVHIFPPGLLTSVLALMRLTDTLVGRTFAATLRDMGAHRRTRLGDRDRRPGAATLGSWPALFSVQALPVYVVESSPLAGRQLRPELVPGDPAALIVPDALLPLYHQADPLALFILGSALAPASMGIGSWHGLPDDLFAAALGTLIQSLVPGFLAAEPRLEHPRLDHGRFRRQISRLPETALRPHALQSSNLGTLDALVAQRRILEVAFKRLALIPIYDPGPVLERLDRAQALDLVTLLLSERHSEARRAVGIAFGG